MHSICSGPFYVNVLIGMAKHTNKRFIFSKLIRMVSICILTKLVHTLGASGLREPRSLFRSNEDSFSDLFFRSSLKVMSTNNHAYSTIPWLERREVKVSRSRYLRTDAYQ